MFLKTVLDFQLRSHEQYLNAFRRAFQICDTNGDGVLSTKEFHQCFMILRKGTVTFPSSPGGRSSTNMPPTPPSPTRLSAALARGGLSSGPETDGIADEDLGVFTALTKMLDPQEYDKITFSSAATCLSKVGSTTSA